MACYLWQLAEMKTQAMMCVMMAPDLINGFSIVLLIGIFSMAYCPLLCWILPDRSQMI
jgi:hypothetical protein